MTEPKRYVSHATVFLQYVRFQSQPKILMYIITCAKNMAMEFAYIRWISLCSRNTWIYLFHLF